ncbi:hypothetical protein N6B72_07425 [Chryseobacterium soli]|uniref:hypothetical protein n=1 Tax=Chryseobacterium soli TaxID=445961 RepID=UPI00295405DA|nr:hypothetical protein [Chryseobacterium soli]MDV7696744.1 hypothetical protein [Chryseobacterium soli]
MKNLIKYPKYTTTLIISDWHHKNNHGIGVDYEYYVNKKRYSYTVNLDLKKNNKYLLIYDSLKPSNCSVLEMYPIIDNNIQTPLNGWKYNDVPIKIDTSEIIEYLKANK